MANMHKDTPNHECREPDNVPFSSSAHVRRQSAYAGTEKGLVNSGKERQKQQVTEAQDGSQAAETQHSMAYSSADAPTPLPHVDMMPPSPMSLCDQEPTDEDIFQDICAYLNEEMDNGGLHNASWCFQHADQKPPITPESLAELDMPRIINNPKLRHDVNFDRELHFRPNLDGSKGRQKMLQADQYWRALEAELVMSRMVHIRKAASTDEAYWNRIMKAALVRLPKIFAAMRDILKSLVPDHDQRTVTERLDVDHIMQQIHNGVCDLIDLGNWLARVLKNHCAPMRDSLVDTMQKEIRRGAMEGNNEKLVNGLRQLMNILEAMKLDVANHQIRHMRPLLIDDTVNFQRRYNAHRISIGKISVADSRMWLLNSMDDRGSHLDALCAGLIRDMLFNDSSSMCPQTFYLDVDRIRALRIELHSRVYHAVCRDVLRLLAPLYFDGDALQRAYDMLQSSVSAIVGIQGRFVDRLENIAVEIMRVLLTIDNLSAAQFDSNLLAHAEDKLKLYLRQDSASFLRHAEVLLGNLAPKVQSRVQEASRMTALDLQDMLVPSPVSSNRNSTGFGAICEPVSSEQNTTIDADEDIIRRFTHVLALHWQVWSELVYLTGGTTSDREEDSASEHGSDSTALRSGSGSPMIPVAQAVYAPGRRWLPVSVTVTDIPSASSTPAESPEPAPEHVEHSAEAEQQKTSDEAADASHRPLA